MSRSPSTAEDPFALGLGNVTWWGFSPGRDLLENIGSAGDRGNSKGEDSDAKRAEACKQVLLVGSGDPRHVVETLSTQTSGEAVKLFVLEQDLLLYARQLLMLALIEDGVRRGGSSSRELARNLMEIMGNIKLNGRCSSEMHRLCGLLARRVIHSSDGDATATLLPRVDLSRLKSRERDSLEAVFKLWQKQSLAAEEEDDCESVGAAHERERNDLATADWGNCHSSVDEFWDGRCRALLGERYDAKQGIIDMDYHMRLLQRGGSHVSHLEYSHWRQTGIAFQWEDCTENDAESVMRPNPSLVSSIAVRDSSGKRKAKTGFWGDIVSGPFFAFGFEAAEKPDTTSQSVPSRTMQARAEECLAERIEKIRSSISDGSSSNRGAEVVFLSVSTGEAVLERGAFGEAGLDAVFLGCSSTHVLGEKLAGNLKSAGGQLWVETPLYLLHLSDEVQAKFKAHLREILHTFGYKFAEGEGDGYDPTAECLVRCIKCE